MLASIGIHLISGAMRSNPLSALVNRLPLRSTIGGPPVGCRARSEPNPWPPAISPRENGTCLVATGATDRQIAARLHITERTVRKHLQDIHARCRSPTE